MTTAGRFLSRVPAACGTQGEITLASQGELLCKYLLQEGNLQCCLVTFGSYAPLARMLFQQPQSQTPQHGKVLRTVTILDAAGVFSKGDIHLPVKVVLDAPVISQHLPITLH